MTRAAFFRLHSWLGITTGVCLLLIAWSGSLVVFNDEIEWLLDPAARADPALGVRPLDDVAAAIRARHPERRFAIHPQIGRHWAHVAYVYEGRTQRYLQIDPATADIRRDDPMDGYTFNVAYFLRQLHVRLLMGFWGRVFVGVFGVTLVLSALTSLVIYREWLRSLVRLRRGHGRRIFHMDLHKAIGLWTLAFNLLFGVTGAVLGLENLYFRLWPAAPRSPAVFAPAPLLAAPLTVDGALTRVTSRDPRFRPTSIEVPVEGPLVVRGDHPGVFIAEGASEYQVHAGTGVVHRVIDARRAPWPEFLYNLLDPLHFGYFGERLGFVTGYAVEIVWCVAGLAPGVLAITGGVMWLVRQRRRSGRRLAADVAGEPV
ncbi:MAG: PepSY-associated TM helix domain-containing protein [Vicinamibacterales bacterium]